MLVDSMDNLKVVKLELEQVVHLVDWMVHPTVGKLVE